MKQKFIKFMQGRYGVDLLTRHLLFVGIALSLLSILLRFPILNYTSIVLIIIVYFRTFSKRITKRYGENQVYLIYVNKVKRFYKKLKSQKDYKYLKCPQCKNETRVPRKKGAITVTCPKCRTKFDAKS